MDDLPTLLGLQDGVITRQQALDRGVTRDAWAWRLKRKRVQRLLPGVVLTHTGDPTQRQKAWAACLYGGRDCSLSGDAALVEQGFKLSELKTYDLVIGPDRRVEPQRFPDGDRVEVRRVLHLPSWRTTRRELPLLNVPAAVLHAAAWAETDRAAEWRLAAVVQRRMSIPRLIRETLEQMPSLKRRRLILDVLLDVEQGAHAASELDFLRFLRRHRLPLPEQLQLKVRAGGTRYLDARYPRQRVTIEVDGAYHLEAAQWSSDALRTLQLVAALPGETVLRVTTAMLRHDEDEVAAALRTILG
jgi:very-short-patch-repair endonuclease